MIDMVWRLAGSLRVLGNEVLALHPGTTVWDIGDADHADEASDHNPNAEDVVCATDTLGNAGLDLGWYAEQVRQAGLGGHPAPKYVIYRRRIASRTGGWVWRGYNGSNPHTSHVHVSVGRGPDGQSTGPYDDVSPWGLLEDDMALTTEDLDRISQAVWARLNPSANQTYSEILRGAARRTDVAEVKAMLAGLAGEDTAAAARAAIREEFATLGPALAVQLATELDDVPQDRIEAAIRVVFGSLDNEG